MDATLVLEDGRFFRGRAFGRTGTATGEVVFNTSLTGYQEILTDPSYRGQMVCMCNPLIGNYGISESDNESERAWLSALIVRELSPSFSNWRATKDLGHWLGEHGVVGIQEIDTRALTKHVREKGAMMAIVSSDESDPERLLQDLKKVPPIGARELVSEVTCKEGYTVPATGPARHSLAVLDFGVKQNILRSLSVLGAECMVFPAATSAADILAAGAQGIVFSNGPGDPATVTYAIEAARELLGKLPSLGICLGHQVIGLALGGSTFKLPFGHHGGNHPVKDLATGRVEITSQNHNYSLDPASLEGAGIERSHVNLNDGTLEGMLAPKLKCMTLQYHPEAAPGPHDSRHLFARFLDTLPGGA